MPLKLKQKGQALSETVIIMMFVGVPIALFLPAISAIFDIQNSAHQASRYVSWERVVGRNNGVGGVAISEEVGSRFYKDPLNGLAIDDPKPNTLWNAGNSNFDSDGALVQYSGADVVATVVNDRDYRIPPRPVFDESESVFTWTGLHYRLLKLRSIGVDYVSLALEMEDDTRLGLNGSRLRSRGAIMTDSWIAVNEKDLRYHASSGAPFDNETVVDHFPILGYIPVVGDALDQISILEGSETMLIARDIPGLDAGFDFLFPETINAAAGGYNMTPEDLSHIIP